jgi:hypothetical protein
MAFAGYWACQAFDRPPITLGDGPALPRYMTQPGQYRLGLIAFVGTCLLVYVLIAYFHQDLVPIVGAINPELQHTIEGSMKDGSLSYPLTVIFSAAIFVSLLKIEKDWNPILVLRRVVHGWMSIPQIANAIMTLMRDELVVPPDARAAVEGDPDTPYVKAGDFDKDRRSLDRRWAELCYIRLWLERRRAQGSHFTFFNEPSFAWDQLQTEYYDVRDRIAPLKQGQPADTGIFAEVTGKVESLRRQYCRLAACFLVFKNETQSAAFRDARQFGVTVTPDTPRANPLRYTAIFVLAIIFAVYLGVSLSAMSWDLLHHNPVIIDSEIATRWMLYALANYGTPIIAVLLLRYLGWRSDPSQPNSYLTSYATIFLLALGVATLCLTAAQVAINQITIRDLGQFGGLLATNIKWAISPAAVSVYIVYHVDRQIDPLLPNIGSYDHWRLPQRLMSCVFFAFLVTGLSVLPTLDISVSRSAWPVQKLQIVILGTTLVVGLVMALVGEFLLVAPATASDAARTDAAGTRRSTGSGSPNPTRWIVAGHSWSCCSRARQSGRLSAPWCRSGHSTESLFTWESGFRSRGRTSRLLPRRQSTLKSKAAWPDDSSVKSAPTRTIISSIGSMRRGSGEFAPSRIAIVEIRSAAGVTPSRSRSMTASISGSKAGGKSTSSSPTRRIRTFSSGAIRDLTSTLPGCWCGISQLAWGVS